MFRPCLVPGYFQVEWLHVGDLHAAGWGEGPRALATPVKATIRLGSWVVYVWKIIFKYQCGILMTYASINYPLFAGKGSRPEYDSYHWIMFNFSAITNTDLSIQAGNQILLLFVKTFEDKTPKAPTRLPDRLTEMTEYFAG